MHIMHRGHNRDSCFARSGDYLRYLQLMEDSARRFECAVHAFVLMTNHVHLLVTPRDPFAISRFMKRVAQEYAQHMNRKARRTGAFWEGRFHSCHVDSEAYLMRCYRYIEMNPVRAGMVRHPADYCWSSFGSNACGSPSSLISSHATYKALGGDSRERQLAYRGIFEMPIIAAELDAIRKATSRGRVLRE